MIEVDQFLSQLEGVRAAGKNQWKARCPAHDDHSPSLSIKLGDDGRILLHCFTGCATEEVLEAMGLEWNDLLPPRDGATPSKGFRKNTMSKKAKTDKAFATARDAITALEQTRGKHSAHWTYTNLDGEPVGLVVRWDGPDGGKKILPVSRNGTGWVHRGMPTPRLLYRLHELRSRTSNRVYLSEGEKCADVVASLGLVSTTTPHGAESVGQVDVSALAGRELIVLPDHDEPGEKYAVAICNAVGNLEPHATIRILRLPGLTHGEDVADWAERRRADGATVDELRDELEQMADRAEVVTTKRTGPVLTCLANVEPREVQWLWKKRFPLGRISLLVGMPGCGKSFLTCDMAARVSLGRNWPDDSPCPQGSVILISAEDDPGDTIRPRLDAHKADVRRIHMLTTVVHANPDGGEPREAMFTLADLPALEASLKRLPDCKLIVIDPIGSFLGSSTDAHRDNEVRAVLAPVALLAERHGAAVVVVAHRRKSGGTVADDLALGSRAFTGIARAVWHLTRDSEDKGLRLLVPGKNNLAPEGDGLAFRIHNTDYGSGPAIYWEAGTISMDADEALAAENAAQVKKKPGPEPETRDEAAEWLQRLLAGGPMLVSEVEKEARKAGFVWRTVQRAAESLNLTRWRDGNVYKWSLRASACQVPQELGNLSSCHAPAGDPKNADSGMADPSSMTGCQDDKSLGELVTRAPEDDDFVDIEVVA